METRIYKSIAASISLNTLVFWFIFLFLRHFLWLLLRLGFVLFGFRDADISFLVLISVILDSFVLPPGHSIILATTYAIRIRGHTKPREQTCDQCR